METVLDVLTDGLKDAMNRGTSYPSVYRAPSALFCPLSSFNIYMKITGLSADLGYTVTTMLMTLSSI